MQTSATQPASTFDSGAATFDMASRADDRSRPDLIVSAIERPGFGMASAPPFSMNKEIGNGQFSTRQL